MSSSNVIFNTNLPALRAQRRLGASLTALSRTFERLSSGLRIARSSDDAAGLAVATSLKADARVFTQGVRNLNDGVSAIRIASGAINELQSIVTRIIELSEQAANGTLSSTQRMHLHREAKALENEYDRITRTTSFNELKLLDGSLQNLSLQFSYGDNGALNTQFGVELGRTANTGTFKASTAYSASGVGGASSIRSADFNGDGFDDIFHGQGGSVSVPWVALANGDGSFKAAVNYGGSGGPLAHQLEAVDVNGDGREDIVFDAFSNGIYVVLNNGNGTFKLPTSYSAGTDIGYFGVDDMNGDGSMDLVYSDNSTNVIYLATGNSNGTFRAGVTISAGFGTGGAGVLSDVDAADLNGDGKSDLLYCNWNSAIMGIQLGNGDGSFKAISMMGTPGNGCHTSVMDINGDERMDIIVKSQADAISVAIGDGTGQFSTAGSYSLSGSGLGVSYLDLNGDKNIDVLGLSGTSAIVAFGNGNGSFLAPVSNSVVAGTASVAAGDVNGDGAYDLVSLTYATGNMNVYMANTQEVTTLESVNLRTKVAARRTLDIMKAAQNRTSSEQGSLGAFESRIESTLNTLAISRSNFEFAASNILDVDVASESSDLVRLQILQQAAAAVLGQANILPQIALQLLRT